MTNGPRRGWGVSVTPRPLFTPRKDPVSIVQEAGWAPGPVWTGVENLASTGIRYPDRPARSQSLYSLSYPVHYVTIYLLLNIQLCLTSKYWFYTVRKRSFRATSASTPGVSCAKFYPIISLLLNTLYKLGVIIFWHEQTIMDVGGQIQARS
jgi:hypothetical protein